MLLVAWAIGQPAAVQGAPAATLCAQTRKTTVAMTNTAATETLAKVTV